MSLKKGRSSTAGTGPFRGGSVSQRTGLDTLQRPMTVYPGTRKKISTMRNESGGRSRDGRHDGTPVPARSARSSAGVRGRRARRLRGSGRYWWIGGHHGWSAVARVEPGVGQGPVTMREATAVVPAASMTGHYSDVLPLGWAGRSADRAEPGVLEGGDVPPDRRRPACTSDLAGLVRPLAQAGVPGR